jgi:hypothetical protein
VIGSKSLMDQTMNPAVRFEIGDLRVLVNTGPEELLGVLLCFNRRPRYHNALDVIGLTILLQERRRWRGCAAQADPPVSSCDNPGSSRTPW